MASSQQSFLARRLDAAALPLAVGDVLVLSALVTFGVVMHNGSGILSSDPGYVAVTVGVFLLGWAVFAPLIGAYSAGAAESAKAAIPLAIRSWVPADVVGVGLWNVVRGTDPVGLVIFATVTILMGSLGLGVWRWLWFKVT